MPKVNELILRSDKIACKAASRVAARWSKISRMRAVRSQTLTYPPKAFSKLRNCLQVEYSNQKYTVLSYDIAFSLLGADSFLRSMTFKIRKDSCRYL